MKRNKKTSSYAEPELQVISVGDSDILVQSTGIDLPLDPLN